MFLSFWTLSKFIYSIFMSFSFSFIFSLSSFFTVLLYKLIDLLSSLICSTVVPIKIPRILLILIFSEMFLNKTTRSSFIVMSGIQIMELVWCPVFILVSVHISY